MATDKRLDQVSNLTDFDYALIVKGTDVAKVTKQQLAELVGNLLYGATTKETLASVVAGLIGVYIGTGSAIRTNISSSFDTNKYPSASGFHVRFDSNSPTGVGYELFFVYGGGLWFKNEQGGGWKEVAIK